MRAVVDTNVLFEGLSKRGPCGDVVDAWVNADFTPCVSTALAMEYEEVLARKFGPAKRPAIIGALQALLKRAEFVPITFTVRPMSPDPDDDFVIDCAFNGHAVLVTGNLKDFRGLEQGLRITVLTPSAFLKQLRGI